MKRSRAEESEWTFERYGAGLVFRRIAGPWRIVRSHWSYTKPELPARP